MMLSLILIFNSPWRALLTASALAWGAPSGDSAQRSMALAQQRGERLRPPSGAKNKNPAGLNSPQNRENYPTGSATQRILTKNKNPAGLSSQQNRKKYPTGSTTQRILTKNKNPAGLNSPQNRENYPTGSATQRILTKNKILSKKLNRHFKLKPISIKQIQRFLIDNSYFQSEVVKTKTGYIIKNPTQTVFVFRGHRFFSEKKLRGLINIDENKLGALFYSFVEADIKSAYHKLGFLQIKITKATVKRGWREWIYLNISEGPRIRVAELRVKGLLSKPDSHYESFIRNNSSALIRKGFYNKKDLEAGYENLIGHLKRQGYLQSKIYSDRISFKGDQVFITIHLEEGPLTLIRDIQIQNAQALPVWEILSHIKSRAQSPLQVDLLDEDLSEIEQLYKSKGYLNMKIANRDNVIQYTPGGKYASIVIQMDEGPQALISKVTVKGLKRANEKMARSLLKFQPGDVLTPLKKEQSLKALGATGIWADISLSEKAVDDGVEALALFKERKPRSLTGGFGVNSERGFTARAYSEIAHRNLFGWGRSLLARASGQINFAQNRAFLEYDLSGGYKEVFIPSYGYRGDVSLSQSKNVFSYSSQNINFVKKTQISFFINKELNEHLRARWNIWSFENRREACSRICPENLQKIGSSSLKFVWDKRDNIFDPSDGNLSSFEAEGAWPALGGSADISFVKADFQNQIYWTFKRDYTLGLAVKGGIISALKNSEYIPVSRAFILGGRASLRGYDGHIKGERVPDIKYASIETANSALKLNIREGFAENARNSSYGLLNVNFRFPLFEGFKGMLFYDLGAVRLKSKSRDILDYGHSVGLGFRYQAFVIPIGWDIAYRLPPKQSFEPRIHFSIGW